MGTVCRHRLVTRNHRTRRSAAGGGQGAQTAPPAFPHFRKSPGREPLPSAEQKILNKRIVMSGQKRQLTQNTPDLVKY